MKNYYELVKKNMEDKVPYARIVVIEHEICIVERKDNGCNTLDQRPFYVKAERICNEIRIKEIRKDIQTNERTCVLEYMDITGRMDTCEVSMEILADAKQVVMLSKYGADVSSNNNKLVLYHLRNEMKKAATVESTNNTGIVNRNGCTMFVGSTIVQKGRNHSEKLVYGGNLALIQRGSRETYMQMIKEEVLPSVPMTAAMLLGLSAPVVGYLGADFSISNIFAHLSGDSTTGKSTVLKLNASLFGSCSSVNGAIGLFATWNATRNAMMEHMAGNHGIAVTIDEAGMSRDKEFSSMIYTLVEGKEKARMTYGRGNNRVREWHTTIISSGEIPLDSSSDAATGQKIRLMDFAGIQWTDDAEHSERILQTIEHNYGFLGETFVKAMFRLKREGMLRFYNKAASNMEKRIACGKFSHRIAGTLAAVVLAGKILATAGLDVDLKSVKKFLIDNANQTKGKEISLGKRAYEAVLLDITTNQGHLEKRTVNGYSFGQAFGDVYGVAYYRSEGGDIENVAIPRERCDAVLKEHKFLNPQLVYEQWKNDGLLKLNSKKGISFKVKMGDVGQIDCLRIIIAHTLEKVTRFKTPEQKSMETAEQIRAGLEKDDMEDL